MTTLQKSRWCTGILAGAAVVALVGGCDRSPSMDSSNRGSDTHTDETTVENAFLVPTFAPGSCAIQVGDDAELSFTATNTRTTDSEVLSGITTDAARAVRIEGTTPVVIPPRSSVAAGQPIEHPGDEPGPDKPFTVAVQGLKESVRPGSSIEVTFQFEKYGDLQVRVPVEACPNQDG